MSKNIEVGCPFPTNISKGVALDNVKGEPVIGVPLPVVIFTWKGIATAVER
jgi:hypothetical protein